MSLPVVVLVASISGFWLGVLVALLWESQSSATPAASPIAAPVATVPASEACPPAPLMLGAERRHWDRCCVDPGCPLCSLPPQTMALYGLEEAWMPAPEPIDGVRRRITTTRKSAS